MFDANISPEAEFMRAHFKEYYLKNFIDSVPEVEKREFGFGVYRRKIANRNMSFSSAQEVNSFLREKVPLFFSYSNSYYKFPSRTPTPAKEWLRSDIIYEFDADELSFEEGHEVKEVNGVQWFEKEHLEEAKKQVFKLINFLESDFNFPSSELAVNFSGKAGFHVHLRGSSIQNLNKKARIELVDYLTAHEMDFVNIGFNTEALLCPKNNSAWAARLKEKVKEILSKDVKEVSKISKVQPRFIKPLLDSKEKLFSSMDGGRLAAIDGKRSKDFWDNILEYVRTSCASPIDRQTSVDLSKIIRLPQTLHGDTGLLAKVVPIDELKSFDPLREAVVLGLDSVKVNVSAAPRFSIGGQSFGPYENKEVELPLFAAVYLVGKGAAVVVKK